MCWQHLSEDPGWMIVEELQFHKNTQDTMLPCSDCGSEIFRTCVCEELQLRIRMSTLVPILSFDNQ